MGKNKKNNIKMIDTSDKKDEEKMNDDNMSDYDTDKSNQIDTSDWKDAGGSITLDQMATS